MSKNNNELFKLIDGAFVSIVWLGAHELLQVTRMNGMTRPTQVSYEENGNKITIYAKKVDWPIAIAETEKDKEGQTRVVSVSPMSLLREKEAESMILRKQKTMDIEQAVKVLARGVDPNVSTAVDAFYSKAEAPELISFGDSLKLLESINAVTTVPHLLTLLPSAIASHGSEHKTLTMHYRDFLEKSPIGAEKIVRALRLISTIAAGEREALLLALSPDGITSPCLRGVLGDSKKDYEAARKVAGKMCLTGAFFPTILMEAEKVYVNTYKHPTFIGDGS